MSYQYQGGNSLLLRLVERALDVETMERVKNIFTLEEVPRSRELSQVYKTPAEQK